MRDEFFFINSIFFVDCLFLLFFSIHANEIHRQSHRKYNEKNDENVDLEMNKKEEKFCMMVK